MRHRLTTIIIGCALTLAATAAAATPLRGAGGDARAVVYRDIDGIVHIVAATETDAVYAQGWAHARDRFFQMDSLRRQASGTLAELLGPSVVGDDVLLRTLGLRRAAERSLTALSAPALATLEAYADGVNAWLAANPLPSEYAALEVTEVAPWEPLDSATIAKLLAFGLSFDLDVSLTTALLSYFGAGLANGFDGEALFYEDLYRSAPFDPASTVPDAGAAVAARAAGDKTPHWRGFDAGYLDAGTVAQAQAFADRLKQVPVLGDALARREGITGSNEWGVAGNKTIYGRPIIANDPHLALNQPATFYQNHLLAPGSNLDVMGSSFAGIPLVVLGHNRHITWGATTNPLDVTDTYQETLAPAPGSAFGLGTVTDGVVEPLELIVLQFQVNQIGDGVADNLQVVGGLDIPPFALIVPRRNHGPIVSLDVPNLSAVSIQYTGFGPTREIDTFRNWNYARNLDEFQDALKFFDFGSQNWAYADIEGNLAYFTSGEMPLREDLQAGTVQGLPPYFIREGTGGNEWLSDPAPAPGQANPWQMLPAAEMPHVINPPAGYFVNANNDPAGTTLDNDPLNQLRPGGGIYYLNPGYAIGARAGRITQALRAKLDAGPVDLADMAEIQANVELLDAEFFTPYIVAAWDASQLPGAGPLLAALGADPRIAEAVDRLRSWRGFAPTGVLEGYDASDVNGVRLAPDAAEVAASINATIYSVWRGQLARIVIDETIAPYNIAPPGSAQTMTALRNLVEHFPANGGIGASGVNFFAVPGVADPDARLAITLLTALSDALDLLAGTSFDDAFSGSTNQGDYRWGRLHRIVFDHPLGGPYNLPSAGSDPGASFADLPGYAVDGGFGAVDASSHSVRAANSHGFTFGSGPVRRYVGRPGRTPGSILGHTILPGGNSGVPGSPWYSNLMGRHLTNDTYRMRLNPRQYLPRVADFVILE